jgi:hypothetical protein
MFSEQNDSGVWALSEQKLYIWLDSRGREILLRNSDKDPLEINRYLQDSKRNIYRLLKSLIDSDEVPAHHLIRGHKEKTFFISMPRAGKSGNESEQCDILGGQIDLFYIEEDAEDKKVFVYDWKTYSSPPSMEARANHLYQLKLYIYLLMHLRKQSALNTYTYTGKIIYLPVSDIHQSTYMLPTKKSVESYTATQSLVTEIKNSFYSLVNKLDNSYYDLDSISSN